MSEARPLLERAVGLAPRNAAPRLALSAVLKELGHHEEAAAVLKKAKAPSEDREMLAKQIETMIALILAKRGTIKSQSLASEDRLPPSGRQGKPNTRPLKPRPRLRRRKIARLSGEGEGQERAQPDQLRH